MVEKPVNCSVWVKIGLFEGLADFFLRESKHAGQTVNEILRNVVATLRGSFLDEEGLVDNWIIHVFKEPGNSHISTVIPSLVKSMLSSEFWNSHLHNLVEKFLIQLRLSKI